MYFSYMETLPCNVWDFYPTWLIRFELEFYGTVNTVKVMSSQLVNLLTLFAGSA